MNRPNKRNVLLCVAGMTPQIITETLYALHKKNEGVDEIRVITTLEGRNKILQTLLDKETGKFFEFCRDYGIDPESIKFDETTIALLDKPDGITLEDIRTPEENTLAGDKICKIVAELCKDKNTKIHASAAGGRKTMSIYLTAAMQIFGRADDTLSHVLVNADFEANRHFFYPPPKPKIFKIVDPITKEGREVSTIDAEIYLAPIPFIRLRGIGVKAFDEQAETYKQTVDKAQSDLRFFESASKLKLNCRKNTIQVADRTVTLSPREFFVYAMFAKFRKENIGEDGFVGLDEITRDDLNKTFLLFVNPEDGEEPIDCYYSTMKRTNYINKLVYEFVEENLIEKKKEKLRQKGSPANNVQVSFNEVGKAVMDVYRQALDKATPKLAAAKMERFDIKRKGEKLGYRFGLEIDPNKIEFE